MVGREGGAKEAGSRGRDASIGLNGKRKASYEGWLRKALGPIMFSLDSETGKRERRKDIYRILTDAAEYISLPGNIERRVKLQGLMEDEVFAGSSREASVSLAVLEGAIFRVIGLLEELEDRRKEGEEVEERVRDLKDSLVRFSGLRDTLVKSHLGFARMVFDPAALRWEDMLNCMQEWKAAGQSIVREAGSASEEEIEEAMERIKPYIQRVTALVDFFANHSDKVQISQLEDLKSFLQESIEGQQRFLADEVIASFLELEDPSPQNKDAFFEILRVIEEGRAFMAMVEGEIKEKSLKHSMNPGER